MKIQVWAVCSHHYGGSSAPSEFDDVFAVFYSAQEAEDCAILNNQANESKTTGRMVFTDHGPYQLREPSVFKEGGGGCPACASSWSDHANGCRLFSFNSKTDYKGPNT